MLRGVNWGGSLFFFMTVLGSFFYSCFGFLSFWVGPLWLPCCSEHLSLLSGKQPGYYPPVWNTCLPTDTVLQLLRVNPGIEIERKG